MYIFPFRFKPNVNIVNPFIGGERYWDWSRDSMEISRTKINREFSCLAFLWMIPGEEVTPPLQEFKNDGH